MKNAWFMIAGRKVNQWCRRQVIRWFGWAIAGRIRKLCDERTTLTGCSILSSLSGTGADYKRIRKINWLLGQGSVIKLTQAEDDRLGVKVEQREITPAQAKKWLDEDDERRKGKSK